VERASKSVVNFTFLSLLFYVASVLLVLQIQGIFNFVFGWLPSFGDVAPQHRNYDFEAAEISGEQVPATKVNGGTLKKGYRPMWGSNPRPQG
jgi:hypothetical protein